MKLNNSFSVRLHRIFNWSISFANLQKKTKACTIFQMYFTTDFYLKGTEHGTQSCEACWGRVNDIWTCIARVQMMTRALFLATIMQPQVTLLSPSEEIVLCNNYYTYKKYFYPCRFAISIYDLNSKAIRMRSLLACV